MDLCLSLTTVLVLMLQALNGVRLQDSTEVPPSTWPANFNSIDTASQSPSVGENSLDMNIKQSNRTNKDTAIQVVSRLNSTSPVGQGNTTDSLPASLSNGTAGNLTSPSILPPAENVSLQSVTSWTIGTTSRDNGLLEVSNATVSSPWKFRNNSWASNNTAYAPNTTVTVAPKSHDNASSTAEHIPGPPPTNSTSTTIIASSTTKTTGLSAKVMAGDSGNNTDTRGFAATNTKARNNINAWGAILGTALAVGFVGFIIYILLKKKNGRQFMHRKLIEDMPSEPVHRLDNSEPLDLKFHGLAYYNPGLQGDHIQMTNFPQGHIH